MNINMKYNEKMHCRYPIHAIGRKITLAKVKNRHMKNIYLHKDLTPGEKLCECYLTRDIVYLMKKKYRYTFNGMKIRPYST